MRSARPIIALAKVTGISELVLAAMTGRILAPFCILVPFWLIWAFAGFSGMLEVWPAILVAGVTFAIPQLLVSNMHGPWVVNVVASVVSMICLIGFLLIWHPKRIWKFDGQEAAEQEEASNGVVKQTYSRSQITQAWIPWAVLSVIVFVWGTQTGKLWMNTPEKIFRFHRQLVTPSPARSPIRSFRSTTLHNLVERVQPVVPKPTKEPAVFGLNWLSATGTGILIAAILSGLIMGQGPGKIGSVFLKTLVKVRFSLLTIAAMLGVGMLTRYSGLDATMGLAFARTGHFYPFFGTLLGWLGVALTGSDTSSNVLFGSLQKITAQQVERLSRADGLGQQRRRSDGQDDRRAKHRGGLHRNPVVRTRGRNSALRLPPLPGIGRAGGSLHLSHGVPVSVHTTRGALSCASSSADGASRPPG